MSTENVMVAVDEGVPGHDVSVEVTAKYRVDGGIDILSVREHPKADPHVKSPLPAQAGGAPVTPSTLESALAKLRKIAEDKHGAVMGGIVSPADARALLARLDALEWQPIETVPKDGREFQAWLWNEPARTGWWGPRCRYSPDGAFQVWQRVDYDDDGWDVVEETPTHWLPQPIGPAAYRTGDAR